MQRTPAAPRPSYNVEAMTDDMNGKGWLPVDLARAACVSHMTVSRFFSGERRTARTAKKLAAALGHSVRRYLIRATEAA